MQYFGLFGQNKVPHKLSSSNLGVIIFIMQGFGLIYVEKVSWAIEIVSMAQKIEKEQKLTFCDARTEKLLRNKKWKCFYYKAF